MNQTAIDANQKQACDFIDSIISCDKAWDGSPHRQNPEQCNEQSWKNVIGYQSRQHMSTCQRKRNGKMVCRFNIPFYPIKETVILSPFLENEVTASELARLKQLNRQVKGYLDSNIQLLTDGDLSFDDFLAAARVTSHTDYINCIRANLQLKKVFICRSPNAILVNNYNRKIISMFRSNMDIQFILDTYACCTYVFDYINKADRGLSKTLEEVYNKHKQDPSSTAFDMLRLLAATYYNSSEISAQEAAYNLLCIRMSEASTGSKFISTSRPESRMHVPKDYQTLCLLDPDSTDCFEVGLIDHYVERPDDLEQMNLAQFAAYFDISMKKPRSGRDVNNNATDNDVGSEDDINDDILNEDDGDVQHEEGENPGNLTDATTTTVIYENVQQEETSQQDMDEVFQNCDVAAGTILRLRNNTRYIKRRTKTLIIRCCAGKYNI